MQNTSEVLTGLVVGHKRDGRCQYDPQVKQELVRRCIPPGVSVARIAMQHGVNANLLRVWIAKAQKQNDIDTPSAAAFVATSAVASARGTKAQATSPTFVPMRIQTPTAPPTHPCATGAQPTGMQPTGMQVRLPNGVQIGLDQASLVQITGVMQMLSALPCSS
jgi:transposase